MGDVVRFPGDLTTEHDKRRLLDAVEASPFDISFRINDKSGLVPYLARCGELRPQWRLRKASGGWEAIALKGEDAGQVNARGRNTEELMRALMSPRTRD